MLKIVFAASSTLACPSLEALHQLKGLMQISAVLTQPDRAVGRKRTLQPNAIKARALELGISTILAPEKINATVRHQIAQLQTDLLVVFAYGKIFRSKFLDLFPLGGINVHPSALPQWRGPSPIEAQLLAGTQQLAISIQRIALEMDAGDILQQKFYLLPEAANYFDAAHITAQQGSVMLRSCCQKIALQGQDFLATAKPQIEGLTSKPPSYCQMLRKEDGRLNWHNSALQLSRQCRAYIAWPKAHTWLNLPQLPAGTREATQPEKKGHSLQINILDVRVWQPQSKEYNMLGQLIGQRQAKFQAQPGTLLALHPRDGILVVTGDGILAIGQLQRQNKNACSAKEFANQLQNYRHNCKLLQWAKLHQLPITELYCFNSSPQI